MKEKFMAMSTRRKVLLVVICILLLLIAAVAATAMNMYQEVAEVFDPGEAGVLEVEEDPDIMENGDRFYNILFVGIDYDPDDQDGLHNYEDGKGMTDVIMYLQIDRDNGTVHILQIPRDTYVGETFSDGSKVPTGKINACYAYGPDQKNLINNLANKIYEQFKLPIDNYVTIDMVSFKTLLNVMGGITMHVPWDIVDSETGVLQVPAGNHAVSGDLAELILRNRNYGSADYQRLETQQYFYAALVRTFLQDYHLKDYYTACKNVAHYINTDLSITELWGLYGTMTTLDPANIFVIRAPGGPIVEHNGHTWLYGIHRDAMANILNTYFRDENMPVEPDQLGLYNDFDFTMGVNVDEGKYLGSIDSGADGDPDDLLHQKPAG